MSDIHEFRSATLKLGNDNVTFAVNARIEESWETISYPAYLDKALVKTVPTLKRITAVIRRRFHESSPLHSAIDGLPLVLEFSSGGETYQFTAARVESWEISGELGGEMMEEVRLVCEEESE